MAESQQHPHHGEGAPEPYPAPQRRLDECEVGRPRCPGRPRDRRRYVYSSVPRSSNRWSPSYITSIPYDLVFVVSSPWRPGQACRHVRLGWPRQLRKTAGGGVGRVRIRDEDPGHAAVIGGCAGRDAGQLLGGCRARRNPENHGIRAHQVSELRGPAVHDGDDDGQRRVRLLIQVVALGGGDPQLARSSR